MGGYNYEHFFDRWVESGQDDREFGQFASILHAGEQAPDGQLTELGGSKILLSKLWQRKGIVLEFGSFT
jgi:hypothetical protein